MAVCVGSTKVGLAPVEAEAVMALSSSSGEMGWKGVKVAVGRMDARSVRSAGGEPDPREQPHRSRPIPIKNHARLIL
jgi:hypothetical protein